MGRLLAGRVAERPVPGGQRCRSISEFDTGTFRRVHEPQDGDRRSYPNPLWTGIEKRVIRWKGAV
jgi:hypothetical protein